MAEIQKLDLSVDKLDKLKNDFEKLKLDPPVIELTNNVQIPTFQRQGYMEKLGHNRAKWFKRFFVLRDSFMLSYNLEKSELTVFPRSCINVAHSKMSELDRKGKLCFFITTPEKDQFLFAVESDQDRKGWMRDIQIARTITHASMVKLAVENQCIAEEKGVSTIVNRDASTSSLSLFSNKEYIKKTPLVGGAEGWLYTPGMNAAMGSKSSKWTKHYFILRDSHLMMFKGGDVLTKPRGCMYLVGTQSEVVVQSEDENLFVFVCKSTNCGDLIELASHSEKYRQRWINALNIGSRVTYRDFKLLLKEHELLAKLKLTPRVGAKDNEVIPPPPILDEEDVDIQGNKLDAGEVQSYTKDGHPILRDPEGRLVDSATGEPLAPTDARFSAKGEQLDAFNRPLPPGALPMFTADGKGIGIGPDGGHYTSDGTEVEKTDGHFDAEGKALPEEAVEAAEGIATNLSVALKVRATLKGEGTEAEVVDALGRSFRELDEDADGNIKNADGEMVPLKSARVMDTTEDTPEMVEYTTYRDKETKTFRDAGEVPPDERTKKIKIIQEEGENFPEKVLGEIEVEGRMSLRDLRNCITKDLLVQDFVFLVESLPLLKYEEVDRLVVMLESESVVIRPRAELTAIAVDKPMIMKKTSRMSLIQMEKEREANEFQDIMARIRKGSYLRKVGSAEADFDPVSKLDDGDE